MTKQRSYQCDVPGCRKKATIRWHGRMICENCREGQEGPIKKDHDLFRMLNITHADVTNYYGKLMVDSCQRLGVGAFKGEGEAKPINGGPGTWANITHPTTKESRRVNIDEVTLENFQEMCGFRFRLTKNDKEKHGIQFSHVGKATPRKVRRKVFEEWKANMKARAAFHD